MTRQEALGSALRANAGKPVRAEDLANYDVFFVDPIDIAPLETNANQLIYGRRGSGKTLLLGTLNTRIRFRFPQRRVMSFMYDATTFRMSPDARPDASVKEQTHAFFGTFITKLCTDLLDLADQVLTKPGWLTALGLSGTAKATRRDALETAVLELQEAASFGISVPSLGDREDTYETKSSRMRRRRRSLDLGVTALPPYISGPTAAAKWGSGTETDATTLAASVIRPRRQFSPGRIKQLIVEVVELLDLEYLVIFIDEWMSLGECQVGFAERLKLCLFNEERIAVKIAADQYQGQLNNSGSGHNFRGLDVGGDIFVELDLDRPFRDRSRHQVLYAEALYRRLHYFEPTLASHFGPPPLSNPERFIDSLFATQQAYTELCLGAQGLCRDFHRLVQKCAKHIDQSAVEGKLDFELVRSALVEMAEELVGRIVHSADAHRVFMTAITPLVVSNRSRYFLVEGRRGTTIPILNDLLSKRAVHSVPSSDLHPSIRGEFDAYELAHGTFIDLMRAAEFATGERVDDAYDLDDVGRITSASMAQYVLEGDTLTHGAGIVLCPHCRLEFSSTERSYVKRGLCPGCFENTDADRRPDE
jgi:hypothetical protein